jgi:hypothetical protein
VFQIQTQNKKEQLMKSKLFLFACLMSAAGAVGQESNASVSEKPGPKVYIFEEDPSVNPFGLNAAYPDNPDRESLVLWSELPHLFAKWCPECRVTIKKETADYVLKLTMIEGRLFDYWSSVLYENKEGMEIEIPYKKVNTFQDVVLALRKHYASIQKVQ